jgi:hypothetical protein
LALINKIYAYFVFRSNFYSVVSFWNLFSDETECFQKKNELMMMSALFLTNTLATGTFSTNTALKQQSTRRHAAQPGHVDMPLKQQSTRKHAAQPGHLILTLGVPVVVACLPEKQQI